jgi:hypothetical protein
MVWVIEVQQFWWVQSWCSERQDDRSKVGQPSFDMSMEYGN